MGKCHRGGYTVRSKIVWEFGGTNTKGLSILPAGQRDTSGLFSSLKIYACFWLPQEHSTDVDRAYEVEVWPTDVNNGGPWVHKTEGLSVRCVRDHEGM